MRRWLFSVVVCSIFGAILNVAVAWAAVLCGEPGYERVVAGRAADRAWARDHLDDQRSGCVVFEEKTFGLRVQGLYEHHPWRWRRGEREPVDAVLAAEASVVQFRKDLAALPLVLHFIPSPNVERIMAGWPCAALECRRVRRWDLEALSFTLRCGNARVRLPLEQDGIYRLHLVCGQLNIEGKLPIRPIPGGFVTNTFFYAAILWLIIPVGSLDDNANGIPDECETFGDLDGDGVVGILDLLILLSNWGPCPDPPAPCPADLDGDGNVGILDLLALLANWG